MSWIAVAIGGSAAVQAGSSIYGSMLQSKASGNAINAVQGMFGQGLNQQSTYVQQAIAQLQAMFGKAQGAVQPFIDTATGIAPTLTKLLTPGADMSDVLSKIPGFEFAQKYGQKAITNQATSRGVSGNALTEGANYATGAASQTYQGIVDALSKIFQTGASAGNSLAGAASGLGGSIISGLSGAGNAALSGASNFGNMLGNLISGQGAAQAAGVLGAGNAVAGGVNSLGNVALLQNLTGKNLLGSNTAGQPTSLAPSPGAWSGNASTLY